jgi:ubiquinone/menaquinone biosynthesis C-methylase UbiE
MAVRRGSTGRRDRGRLRGLRRVHVRLPTRATAVERYWNRHTVNSKPFRDAQDSEDYLDWRFDQYPLFREFTGLWGDHTGERILDHGCGPGNDVTGFLLYARPAKVIGLDVSAKALRLARRRLALHDFDSQRFELVQIRESDGRLPVDDASIDHVNSSGVIHHIGDPQLVLEELRRVLKPTGTCTVMVYNRDSVYFHLYTAFMRMILEETFAGLTVEEAFRRNTDGPECPISRAYRGGDFLELCRRAGLTGDFVGGYFLKDELDWLRDHGAAALASPSLADEHKEFLAGLELDGRGYPRYRGKHAGIGGVYHLRPQ